MKKGKNWFYLIISLLVVFSLYPSHLINFFSLANAVYKGEAWRVDLLLALGEDINEVTCWKNDCNATAFNPCYTPLTYAILNQHADMVDKLLALDADVRLPKKNPPLEAAIYSENLPIIKMLLNAGAKFGDSLERKIQVIGTDNVEILKLYIDEQNLSLEKVFCGASDEYNILKYTLESGVNPNTICGYDQEDIKKFQLLLIEQDSKNISIIDKQTKGSGDKVGSHKLFSVSMNDGFKGNNSGEITQILIDYGADIDIKDDCNNTPLHNAVKREAVQVVRALLENNATIGFENCEGRTAYELGKRNKWITKAFEENQRH